MLQVLQNVKPRQWLQDEPRLPACITVVLSPGCAFVPQGIEEQENAEARAHPQTNSLRILGLGSGSGYLLELSKWFYHAARVGTSEVITPGSPQRLPCSRVPLLPIFPHLSSSFPPIILTLSGNFHSRSTGQNICSHGSQLDTIPSPLRRHLAMFGGISGCHPWGSSG